MIRVKTPNITLAGRCEAQLPGLLQQRVASRIAAKDSGLWGVEAAAEAEIRLNWLDAPADGLAIAQAIAPLALTLRSQGINTVVLSGMGGSSLAPEVIARAQDLRLIALDSTSPDQVQAALSDLEHTVLVNSSKSGSTVETDSHRRIFESEFTKHGIDSRERIVFVTDPGSPLSQDAQQKGFKHIVEADPNIGGRFSALTAFGIVPTILAGGSVTELLEAAEQLLPSLQEDSSDNPALVLAAALAQPSPQQNKLIIVEDPAHAIGLGDWIEQLIAESTGKEQTGILPVIVGVDAPELKSAQVDQMILWLGSAASAEQHGVDPDVVVDGTLGEQFLLWEYATSIMGYLLGINPFDQPDVESAKSATRRLLDQGIQSQQTTELLPGLGVRGHAHLGTDSSEISVLLDAILSKVDTQGYVSIQAYLNREAHPEFLVLRNLIAERTGRPTTFGWGPRFLHSTGQFHKGGQRQGAFLQLIEQGEADLHIPGREFSFAQLLSAQADGDREVLAATHRPVLGLVVLDAAKALQQLIDLLKG